MQEPNRAAESKSENEVPNSFSPRRGTIETEFSSRPHLLHCSTETQGLMLESAIAYIKLDWNPIDEY